MENDLKHEIHLLAYALWRSAGSNFGPTALDFWVMAEQMVRELATDSSVYRTRLPPTLLSPPHA